MITVNIISRLLILVVLVSGVTATTSQRAEPSGGGNRDEEQAWVELIGSMQKMHVAMNTMKSSNNVDVDFVQLMLPHHQAAIDMAKTQLVFGKDPQMRRLAQEIITEQQSEIDLMQLWLKQHAAASTKAK